VASRAHGASGRTWLVRGLVALVLGLGIGGATGVVGVRKLEPGRPGQADSLQLMLDSLQRMKADDPREQRRAVDSADAARRNRRFTDSMALANDSTAPRVPVVVELTEGAAREALEMAGLTVGAVEFRASTSAAGTVLASTPVAGVRVRAGTAVNLVLSDGRPPLTDTTDVSLFHSLHFQIP
jgi:hypothetical protein